MINWRKTDSNISIADVEKVEQSTQVQIPDELKDLVLTNNHGRPDKMLFDTDVSKEHVLGSLLNFNPGVSHSDNIVTVFDSIKTELPKDYFPFASDPAGNFICAKIINTNIDGIYFWNHENQFTIDDGKIAVDDNLEKEKLHKVEFISKTLNEFLDKLYKEED